MAESEPSVKVARCPLCQKEHLYRLHIETTMVMGLVAADAPFIRRDKNVRIAAPCPEKNESYLVSLTVPERPNTVILNVSLTLAATASTKSKKS